MAYYRARIVALAEQGIYVGTSSWTYEGWLGGPYLATDTVADLAEGVPVNDVTAVPLSEVGAV